ncbi:MAG: cobyrinate a,c-diamide synthase [Rhizobiaceae bacterium]
MSARGLIIGAARSGAGKTSITIGLLRAFARRGVAVRGAKSGPDYIDPAFHAAATGRPGLNLDSWAMAPELVSSLLAGATDDTELVIVESAMGLFDGIPGEKGRTGAAADLARRYGVPAILVLDVSGQSTTAAAIAHGFRSYDPDVAIAGVILNQVASDRHQRLCGEAIEALGIRVLGAIRRDPELKLPERHLGLVQAREHGALETFINKVADTIDTCVDLDRVMGLAAPIDVAARNSAFALPPPGQRIALADDAAFSFLYPHHHARWRAAGAEIVPFSPLADESPRLDCDVCWLPGGYPELHAGRLSSARNFRKGMERFAETSPIHGECGGFMVLGEAIEDAEGATHRMLGLLGQTTSFAKRRMNLGYRRARLVEPAPLGPVGTIVRGHEFHYAVTVSPGSDTPLAELADGEGRQLGMAGARRGHVTGTFFHAIARD